MIILRLPAAICSLAVLASCATAPPSTPTVVVPVEVLNPDVRPETIDQTICVPGYTASVRPATSYTNGVKAKLLRESGTDAANASKYELDHVIPLAVGGHPRCVFHAIADTHFTRSRTAFHGKADTVSR